jgi:hypothetical protein
MASYLKVDILETAVGGPTALTKQSAAKAWQATDGAAAPILSMSFNTTSLTDSGVGDLTFNLTSAMSTSTYAVPSGYTLAFDYATAAAPRSCLAYTRTTTTTRCISGAYTAGPGAHLDFAVYYAMLGDLA